MRAGGGACGPQYYETGQGAGWNRPMKSEPVMPAVHLTVRATKRERLRAAASIAAAPDWRGVVSSEQPRRAIVYTREKGGREPPGKVHHCRSRAATSGSIPVILSRIFSRAILASWFL